MIGWSTAGPAVTAAFLASMVEVVEAFTIVLAAATIAGLRPATLGTIGGLGVLAVIVLVFGPILDRIPLNLLQLAIGVLLLLFGLRWLRKAILRAAGVLALRNERMAFEESEQMLREAAEMRATRLKWLAMLTAFKAVVIEGLEVVFIVIAVGSGHGLLIPASLGALAACLLVLVIGIVVRQPLARVPENTLKFCVGVMLAAFGVFWTGEGLGVAWAGADLAILAFIVVFLTTGLILVKLARHRFAGIPR